MHTLILLLAHPSFAQDAPAGRVPMELGLRFRSMSVPDSIVDVWAYDETDPDEPPPVERPKVKGSAFGLEYSLVQPQTLWTFYFERFKSGVEDGYWDDVDDGEIDHYDGYWIAPTDNFGMFNLGVNTGRDFPLSSNQNPVFVSLHLSGGLGIGIVTGELTQWVVGNDTATVTVNDPDCLPASPAYERYETCGDDGSVRIPGVLPLIDGNLGLKLNFPYGYVRLEGGLHDMFYWGASAGGHF